MINRDLLNQIKDHALYIDWEVAFKGKSKGNRHLFRVAAIADFIARIEDADRDICEAGAWIHDIGLMHGNDDNPLQIRTIANNFLITLPLQEKIRERIVQCVESHEGMKTAQSIEAMVVHDADVLDKMGVLGIIRHTWKIVNLIEPDASDEEIYQLLLNHLQWRKSKLYTKTGRKLAKVIYKQFSSIMKDKTEALSLIKHIRIDAKRGVITEKIAQNLVLQSEPVFKKILMSQLDCSNLPSNSK